MKTLDLSCKGLTKIENIPKGVKELYLYSNNISKIDKQSKENILKSKTEVYGVDIEKLEVE